jgi:hypothetical protein
VALFERAWNLLLQVKTDRADREGHPMDIDPDTGEVIDPSETPKNATEWHELHDDEELPW